MIVQFSLFEAVPFCLSSPSQLAEDALPISIMFLKRLSLIFFGVYLDVARNRILPFYSYEKVKHKCPILPPILAHVPHCGGLVHVAAGPAAAVVGGGEGGVAVEEAVGVGLEPATGHGRGHLLGRTGFDSHRGEINPTHTGKK